MGITDFKVTNTPRTYENLFDIFIQNKSETILSQGVGDIHYALNIDTLWDNNFPETIRLKYPGIITSNSFSERKKLGNETNYTFKI